jgi:hypothetical protein
MTVDTSTTHEQAVEQVAQRVLDMALGTAELLAVYLGDRLGWYRSLHTDGPATAEQLAQRTGTSPRYAREWLEQQTVSGASSPSETVTAGARLPATGGLETGAVALVALGLSAACARRRRG